MDTPLKVGLSLESMFYFFGGGGGGGGNVRQIRKIRRRVLYSNWVLMFSLLFLVGGFSIHVKKKISQIGSVPQIWMNIEKN